MREISTSPPLECIGIMEEEILKKRRIGNNNSISRGEFTVEILRLMLKIEGIKITPYGISKVIGVDPKTIKSWISGDTFPSKPHQISLIEYLTSLLKD